MGVIPSGYVTLSCRAVPQNMHLVSGQQMAHMEGRSISFLLIWQHTMELLFVVQWLIENNGALCSGGCDEEFKGSTPPVVWAAQTASMMKDTMMIPTETVFIFRCQQREKRMIFIPDSQYVINTP